MSEQPPTRTTGKVSHAIAKAALGSIPLAGAGASELFAFVITRPLERRRDEWMHAVAERLGTLEDRRAESLTYLQYDESFLDTVLQASQIALRTHHEEKRHALLNAITNAAMPHAPDESERQMFLGLIDAFTDWHLRLLVLFDDPTSFFESHGKRFPSMHAGSLSHLLEAAYPELKDRREFYDQVWRDLHASGLVLTNSLHVMMSERGIAESRTTQRAKTFLRFVSDPDENVSTQPTP